MQIYQYELELHIKIYNHKRETITSLQFSIYIIGIFSDFNQKNRL